MGKVEQLEAKMEAKKETHEEAQEITRYGSCSRGKNSIPDYRPG
jgi:hypothetical protein